MVPSFWQFKAWCFKIFRKRTLGARALVIANNKVLLVKHTYTPKWYTIGGGIDQNETPIEAIQRELFEETGVQCTSPPKLFGVYYNNLKQQNDYVVFYIVTDFKQTPVSSVEILEAKWFAIDDLPPDTSEATKRRLDEYLGKRTQEERW